MMCPDHGREMKMEYRPEEARLGTGPWFWVCPEGELRIVDTDDRPGGPAPDRRLTL